VAQAPFAKSGAMEELAREASGGSEGLDPDEFNVPNLALSETTRAFFYKLVQKWEAMNTANAVAAALARAIEAPSHIPIPVPFSTSALPTAEFIVNTVSRIKDHVPLLKDVETTLGSSSYQVVDARGNFDERTYNTRLRKHLRDKLQAPGQTASGGLQDAIILTNLPAPDRCASVTKDGGAYLWITTTGGKQRLEEYFKDKISAGQGDALRNIELVYVKKGRAAQITAENAKKSAQQATQSVKSKKGGRKKK
jgi:hypothetical protein